LAEGEAVNPRFSSSISDRNGENFWESPDKISSVMNIRVADIQTRCELWKSRGAESSTEPKDEHGETRCYIRDPDG
jgi:hypothetical protein